MKTILLFVAFAFLPITAQAASSAPNNDTEEVISAIFDFSDFADEVDTDRRRGKFKCVAENRRGRRYKATDRRRYRAERKALRKCRRDSRRPRTCQIVRCKKQRRDLDPRDILDIIFR